MGAKVTLTGKPKNIQFNRRKNIVSFTIRTGPEIDTPPKGFPLFEPSLYVIKCSGRQWKRGHFNEEDESELTIEGYLRPEIVNGKPSIVVITTMLKSVRKQQEHQLTQLVKAYEKVKETFEKANAQTPPPKNLDSLAKQLVKTKNNLANYREKNPGLSS